MTCNICEKHPRSSVKQPAVYAVRFGGLDDEVPR